MTTLNTEGSLGINQAEEGERNFQKERVDGMLKGLNG